MTFDEWWNANVVTLQVQSSYHLVASEAFNAGLVQGLQRAVEIAREADVTGLEACDVVSNIAEDIDREAETKGRAG